MPMEHVSGIKRVRGVSEKGQYDFYQIVIKRPINSFENIDKRSGEVKMSVEGFGYEDITVALSKLCYDRCKHLEFDVPMYLEYAPSTRNPKMLECVDIRATDLVK